ncbi:hypothetical protein SAY87_004039 [Trapa incisa]|uniref:Uncharacterized protein n=1 Tax=Trapa incisa TaxID=236973 RepID=A0AAN7PJH2_9MYRT|nr:hypothetical protein SAY87_004039 [Trapa incisa]
MAVLRRRQNYYHRLRRLLPVVSLVSCALLIFFSLVSFLYPSPVDVDHRHLMDRRSTSNFGVDNDATGVQSLRIPTKGGRPDRDIWSSPNAKFYYGCSNASSKFLRPETITQPNRYLIIATSGGLNQQRTGSKATQDSGNRKLGKRGDTLKEEPESLADDLDIDNEPDWMEQEDEDQDDGLSGRGQFNETIMDYDSGNSDEPELDELLSD